MPIEREVRHLRDGERRGGFDRVSRQVFTFGELYEQLRLLPSGRAIQLNNYLDAPCRRITGAAALSLRGTAIRADLHAFAEEGGGLVTVRLLACD